VPPGQEFTTAWQVNNHGQVLLWLSGIIWQDGRYTDIGGLGGGFTGAWSINDAGDVVGDSDLADGTAHAFWWRQGRMVDLGTLGGATSNARSVGAQGDVAGRSALPDGSEHVFHWRAGVMTDTGIPSGFTSQIHVNARGQIVADYQPTSPGPSIPSRAYLWQRGVVTDLGSLGGDYVQVRDINDRGEIVGTATTAAGDQHAFLWWQGRMVDLGTLGGSESGAADINNRGQITGVAQTARGIWHAFRWENGVMTDLAASDRTVGSWAAAINERGDVVGGRTGEAGTRGMVWRGGRALELDTLGRETSQGGDINDSGLAVGLTSPGPFEPSRATVWNTAGR